MDTVNPVDVIGAGRVGAALTRRATALGVAGQLVTRTAGWEALAHHPGRPLLVATRNDDLDGVLVRLPPSRRADLVFLQNGMLRPWLGANGLEGAGRLLLYAAVASREAEPVPGPDPSPVTGAHAHAVAAWLTHLGVPAAVVGPEDFASAELEKLVWNVAFGVICQARGVTVDQVCALHAGLLRVLVGELVGVAAPALDVEVEPEALLRRLCAYSQAIAGYRAAVKEWPWRDGWFVQEARRRGQTLAMHRSLLDDAGVSTRR